MKFEVGLNFLGLVCVAFFCFDIHIVLRQVIYLVFVGEHYLLPACDVYQPNPFNLRLKTYEDNYAIPCIGGEWSP